MNTAWTSWVPVLLLAVSLLTALLIFPLREDQVRRRTVINLTGAASKLILVAVMFWGSFNGLSFETRFPFVGGVSLAFRVDYLSLLFVTLSAILWFVTTVYAIGYLEGSPHRSRFFGFFSLCVTATMGIAMAANLLTFFVFYEFLTVVTYPLVVHRGTARSLAAGRVYLLYTLTGGTILLSGIVLLYATIGPTDFVTGGAIPVDALANPTLPRVIFALLVGGLAVKAAIFPLHGWLPAAMIAPAPVSALLHAVAVVKAGAFGIVRVVYDVYGVNMANQLGLLEPLAALAGFTVIYGSVRALGQDDLKRRLAFSTISQISYIVMGVAVVGMLSTVGGLVHLLHQGIMKVTLFFCAGLLVETIGVRRVSEMNGVGRRMPLTMAAFTIAALGMIGIPPMAGFITKWYLGLGALAAGERWVIAVIALGSLLNAAYMLPMVGAAWFRPPDADVDWPPAGRYEANRMLLYPTLVTGALTLAAGFFASVPFSPLWLVSLVAEELYPP